MAEEPSGSGNRHPDREPAPIELPLARVLSPIEKFADSQATTGVFLLVAVVLALWLANSQHRELYLSLNHLPFGISLGDWQLSMSLHHWVNEGLMVLFFFILGLEIKREVLAGDLRDIRNSSLVLFMALGGMVLPASVYLLLTLGAESAVAAGWGIPMATDTAFALGILGLLGARAPRAAVLLLSALAIVDDIGAVLVISLYYSSDLNLHALYGVGATFAGLCLANLAGIRRPVAYVAGGILLWWFVLQSGVHATVAGILVAVTVPAHPYAGTRWFRSRMARVMRRIRDVDKPDQSILENRRQYEVVETARDIAQKATTPLQRWEDYLDKPVSLAVLPLFAFLNAGIVIDGDAGLSGSPVLVATAAGLVIGKVLGISALAWLGLRTGLCRLPAGIRFIHIVGLGLLAGIGFTMSLFIAALAFAGQPDLLVDAKLGILAGSAIAGVLGVSVFLWRPADSVIDGVDAGGQ